MGRLSVMGLMKPEKPSRTSLDESYGRVKVLNEKKAFDDVVLLDDSPFRRKVAAVVHSTACQMGMGFAVMSSIVLVVLETDARAEGVESGDWLVYTMFFLLFLYCWELLARLYVSGLKFFLVGLNVMDFVIVVLELATVMVESFAYYIADDLPNVMVMRFLRLIRLARLSSFMMRFRPLYLILQGFFSAMQAIFFATVLILICLTLWSIFAVEFLHPISQELTREGAFDDCARCPHAFETVMQSNFTFLQTIVVGDAWSQILIPLIERRWSAALIVIGVFITVQVGMLNLILAVIVDSASQAREDDEHRKVHEKETEFKKGQARFARICKELDSNDSGTLTEEELFTGLEQHPELNKLLASMDVSENDLGVLFKMMDCDKSGDVSYDEFAELLHRLKNEDMRTNIIFLKYYVLEILANLNPEEAQAEKMAMVMGSHSTMKKGSPRRISDESSTEPLRIFTPIISDRPTSPSFEGKWEPLARPLTPVIKAGSVAIHRDKAMDIDKKDISGSDAWQNNTDGEAVVPASISVKPSMNDANEETLSVRTSNEKEAAETSLNTQSLDFLKASEPKKARFTASRPAELQVRS